MSRAATVAAVLPATDQAKNVVSGILKEQDAENTLAAKLSSSEDLVLRTFRLLVADLCQQFNGGHPG